MGNLLLPDTAMLYIICFCDVQTLKCLRLASRSMCNLISTYQSSICVSITNRVFSTNEITSLNPLLNKTDLLTPLRILFTLDYRIHKTKWLSAVVAENIREENDPYRSAYRNYSANDPQGNYIRSLLTEGWAVLWRLSDIAYKVIGEQLGNSALLSAKHVSCVTRGLPSVQDIEFRIQQEQQAYSRTILQQKQLGYELTLIFLRRVFHDRVFDNLQGKTSPNWRTGNNFGEIGSWLRWLIIRQGPSFFIKAWASKEGNEACLRLIRTEWAKRSRTQILIESEAFYKVELVLTNVHESLRDTVEGLMEDGRGNYDIEREFKNVYFFVGRKLECDVINSIEREYSDYSS